MSVATIVERVAVDGWPGHRDRPVHQALQAVRDYLDEIRPAALAVMVATGYGYRRPDGVAVVPIGALGP